MRESGGQGKRHRKGVRETGTWRGTSIHMGLPCPRPSLTAPACPLSPALQVAHTMLLFFILEKKWPYISYRNLLPGAKGDLRKISLASMLAELLAGVPRRRALAVPSQGPARFLACSPWSAQPLLGPGLITRFSCPVLVNSPWVGPDLIHVSGLASCFAGTPGACLWPNPDAQLCSDLQLLGTCWVWLKLVPNLAPGSPGLRFPTCSGMACNTDSR